MAEDRTHDLPHAKWTLLHNAMKAIELYPNTIKDMMLMPSWDWNKYIKYKAKLFEKNMFFFFF